MLTLHSGLGRDANDAGAAMTLAVSADMELILLQRDIAAESKPVPSLSALSQGTPTVSLSYSFHSLSSLDSIKWNP